MLIPAGLLVAGTFVGAYVARNPIIQAGVIHGGRVSFQSDVSLLEVASAVAPKEADVDLSGLQIPDRNELTRNLIQAGELSAKVNTIDLVTGKVHVGHLRAKDVELFAPRKEPAEPLPEVPGANEDVGPGADEGALTEKLLEGEGSLLGQLGVKEVDPKEVLDRLDLQSVAYAKGLPARMEEREKVWRGKLEAHQAKLADAKQRAEALAKDVGPLTKQIRQEWSQAYGAKVKELDALKKELEEDSKACGPNPPVDIPRRVKKEVDELKAVQTRLQGQAKDVHGRTKAVQDDLAALAEVGAQLKKDAAALKQEGEAELAKASAAAAADKEKLAELIEPGSQQVDEILTIVFGPEMAERAAEARGWLKRIRMLFPAKDELSAPPRTPREGQIFAFPPPEVEGGPPPVGFLAREVDLSGKLHLDGERPAVIGLSGKVTNISNDPWRLGDAITFDLECSLGAEGGDGMAFGAEGRYDPAGDELSLALDWEAYTVDGLVLREGDATASDLAPRVLKKANARVKLTATSTPDRYEVSLEVELKSLEWGDLPPADAKVVELIRSTLTAVDQLHLRVTLGLDRGGKASFAVEDLGQPKLTDALAAELTKFLQEEVDRVTAECNRELEARLAKENAAAKGALAAGQKRVDGELQTFLADHAAAKEALGTDEMDGVLKGMDAARDRLAKKKGQELLKAATKGSVLDKIKIPGFGD
jgi:predicted  nucleic acid-binding Zn-ribbon protein